jgi:hypothetical protein
VAAARADCEEQRNQKIAEKKVEREARICARSDSRIASIDGLRHAMTVSNCVYARPAQVTEVQEGLAAAIIRTTYFYLKRPPAKVHNVQPYAHASRKPNTKITSIGDSQAEAVLARRRCNFLLASL